MRQVLAKKKVSFSIQLFLKLGGATPSIPTYNSSSLSSLLLAKLVSFFTRLQPLRKMIFWWPWIRELEGGTPVPFGWTPVVGCATRRVHRQRHRQRQRHRSHDTRHNDTQLNDTWHNDTWHNDTWHNDTQHSDTQPIDIQRGRKKAAEWVIIPLCWVSLCSVSLGWKSWRLDNGWLRHILTIRFCLDYNLLFGWREKIILNFFSRKKKIKNFHFGIR